MVKNINLRLNIFLDINESKDEVIKEKVGEDKLLEDSLFCLITPKLENV